MITAMYIYQSTHYKTINGFTVAHRRHATVAYYNSDVSGLSVLPLAVPLFDLNDPHRQAHSVYITLYNVEAVYMVQGFK